MIICSCNRLSVEKIQKAIQDNPTMNTKEILTVCGWVSLCSFCIYDLTKEIKIQKKNLLSE